MIPPKTMRYCRVCENVTWFEYNPNRTHSECIVCAGHTSIKLEHIGRALKSYETAIKKRDWEIEKLTEYVNVLEAKLNQK